MTELSSSQSNARPPRPDRHVVTLVKGDDRWRFRLEPGNEHEMIDAVASMASDPAHPLDWFDAAIVSHQITRQLESRGPTTPGASSDAA